MLTGSVPACSESRAIRSGGSVKSVKHPLTHLQAGGLSPAGHRQALPDGQLGGSRAHLRSAPRPLLRRGLGHPVHTDADQHARNFLCDLSVPRRAPPRARPGSAVAAAPAAARGRRARLPQAPRGFSVLASDQPRLKNTSSGCPPARSVWSLGQQRQVPEGARACPCAVRPEGREGALRAAPRGGRRDVSDRKRRVPPTRTILEPATKRRAPAKRCF